jgi:hypothetical protein
MAKMTTMLAYVRVVAGAVVLVAAVVLGLLQWANSADVSIYGKGVSANTGWLMFFSAVGGAALWWVIWQFIRGVRVLAGLRRQERNLAAQFQRLQAAQAPPPPPDQTPGGLASPS